LIALAASQLRAPENKARMSMCQGARIRIDRAAVPLGVKPLLAKIVDKNNRLLWIRRRAPERLRRTGCSARGGLAHIASSSITTARPGSST
jgi:hypothetical protein